MKQLVEAVLENLSTKEVFRFQVLCACCRRAYGNRPVKFSKAAEAVIPGHKQLLYEAMYEQEFRDAKRIAIRTAAEHLNYCPVCKRLACNECFYICDELDMCRDCAYELEQQGHAVANFEHKIDFYLGGNKNGKA